MPKTNDMLYRGLALPLNGAVTPTDILDAAKLNWKVCELPVLMQGQNENRIFPNRKALVRCDNGHPIEIVSNVFKVHQNLEIVQGLATLAQSGGIVLDHGGSLNGGSDLFLHGHVDRKFDASGDKKRGDNVRLEFSLRGGHRPGAPTTLKAVMMRLICLNGATIPGAVCTVRQTHRQKWNGANNNINEFVANALREFETYESKAKRLMGFAFTREMTRAYVIELMQPELLKKAAEMTMAAITTAHPAPLQNLTGAQVLDQILSRGDRLMYDIESGRAGKRDEELKLGRSTRQVLEAVETQPGYEMAANTAWGAYNAATYYVDHMRGRGSNPDSAVESALMGEGARVKERALDLAIEYTERVR